MNFRENLVHLRAVNNMTQEQLAMLLGVSRQSVAKWEAGKSYPEMDKLLALCQVFNCTLDELVQGNLTERRAEESLVRNASSKPEDIFGYDEQMRSFASKISNGVMAIIIGVAACVLFGVIGDANEGAGNTLNANAFIAIGVLLLFSGIATGLVLIVPAGMSHSSFVKAHPFIEDFYSPEEKEQARTTFVRELIGGICCIFLGVCVVIFLANTSFEDILGTPIMLLLTATGVRFIIHGGLTLGRVNLDEYNNTAGEYLEKADIENSDLSPEQKERLMTTHMVDRRIGAICGTIMMIATIAGLVMLFVPGHQNELFWLAWPIGGLLCGIAALLIKGFSKDA